MRLFSEATTTLARHQKPVAVIGLVAVGGMVAEEETVVAVGE